MKPLLLFAIMSIFWTDTIGWKDLTDVKFKRKFIEKEDMYFLFPTFGPKVKALEGKEIKIKGYMIPLNPAENIYVLSATPMAQCFFCGGSGPETIIELKLKTKRRYNTDEVWTVKGVFRLNADNLEECNYILDDAEPVIKH